MEKKRTRRGRQIDGAADDGAHAPAKTASGPTINRGLARPKDDKENIGAPEVETKDRIERITKAMNGLAENRWNRKHKLLPNLKLTYPSDEEIRHIAELAKVDDALLLRRSIDSIILDAHQADASFRTLSIPQVRKALNGVATHANRLGKILSKLDVGRGSKGSENEAGRLIELELAVQPFEQDGMVLLPEFIDLLGALSRVAERAACKPMHVPKGAGGNPAFDSFVEDLLMAARMQGGRWTNSRSRDETWTGTLLETLGLLKRYLPQNFFPAGELGRSIAHIRAKLADHIQRAP